MLIIKIWEEITSDELKLSKLAWNRDSKISTKRELMKESNALFEFMYSNERQTINVTILLSSKSRESILFSKNKTKT